MSTQRTAKETIDLSITVNGTEYEREVPSRMLLVHFLRDELGLTGSRVGCETSSCGCCTTLLDGRRVKSCTLLAAQANNREVTTIEGLADDEELNVVQQTFSQKHALQCGYCTAGMVMSAHGLLSEGEELSRDEIKHGMAGNLCRCTGYNFIVDAIEEAAASDNLPDEAL
ncbi:(2Fe-2S)-binding protein [Salinigranum sp. GCM10025319]|uniref:(2Fe-2S)-binding protein n=1 Tax=Salinigranum sp. GCM10025319 TaxID=3252687 RepID=UPI003608AD93